MAYERKSAQLMSLCRNDDDNGLCNMTVTSEVMLYIASRIILDESNKERALLLFRQSNPRLVTEREDTTCLLVASDAKKEKSDHSRMRSQAVIATSNLFHLHYFKPHPHRTIRINFVKS